MAPGKLIVAMDPVTVGVVGWSARIVGWVASPLISKLLSKGYDYLGYDTAKKLGQLEPKVLVLERVMQVVETSPDRPRLEKLFKELKTAYYEAEEILDAVEYHCLERQIKDAKLQSNSGATTRKRDCMKKKLWSAMAKFSPLKNKESGMKNTKLIHSLKKIEDVINEAHQILDKLNLSSISNGNRRQTMVVNNPTTAASPHKVFGRDNDRDKIIAMLHEKDDDLHPSTSNGLCFSVIGIHGVGGSGKSTLVQFVYAHEEKEGHFDLVMWVHVSQNFSVGDIFKELYEATSQPKDASEPKVPCPQFHNLNTLEKELERKLDGKRFLLVLDDVWCNKDVGDQNLPELLSPLKVGKRGSKILVTTRSKYALPDLCKHLRYLAFRTDSECTVILPSSLNQLYQMQLLDFGQCDDLVFSCGDLINLRHVCSGLELRISNISRLVSLQRLSQFIVSHEQGHEAKQLRYLNRLSGEVYISGLENVESREEALEFDLTAKKRLTDLTLAFIGSLKVAAEVLEGLCPPVGLEKLTINGYEGLVYPNWMVGRQNGGPEKLQNLKFWGWRQPGPAPELEAFIHLRSLTLLYCSWNALPGNMEHLSLLEKLWIQGCLNVRSLPTLPQSLEDFILCDCNDGFMKSCETDGHPNWQKLQHIPNKYIQRLTLS